MFGGSTPGILPGAGQPPAIGIGAAAAPAAAPLGGFMGNLAGTLFGAGPGGVADPNAQRRALLQLGLGMLAGANQHQGFGQGALGAYLGAANTYEGAMQRAYTNSERLRLESKTDAQKAADEARAQANWQAEQQQRMDLEKMREQAASDRMKAQIAGSERVAGMQTADDRVRSKLLQQEADRQAQMDKLAAPLAKKIADGTATTQDMIQYQLLTKGTVPSGSFGFGGPLSGGFGAGGMGGPWSPNASSNPLLNDPRL